MMDEQQLDELLAALAAEEFEPDARLLSATRRRIYRARFLGAALFASLALQTLIWIATLGVLLSPEISSGVKLGVFFSCLALWGCVLIVLAVKRGSLAACFERLEVSLGGAA